MQDCTGVFAVRLLPCVCVVSLVACGTVWDDLVARRAAEPNPAEPPALGIGGAAGAGSVPALALPRGRVRVEEGRLVTDVGTPLRGVILPVDVGWVVEDFSQLEELAETSGLNALHVYAENWSDAPGDNLAIVDTIVSQAASAGLYVILGRGGGPDAPDHPGNGWFDLAQVQAFWDVYASRYAVSSHVIYEIQNNPELSCDAPSPATIELQRAVHARIRAVAPETHVGLYSFFAIPTIATFQAAVGAVDDVVDWSNTSIFHHGSEQCAALTSLASLVESSQLEQVPLLASQLPFDGWEPALLELESLGLGWISHRWLTTEPTHTTWVVEAERLGLDYCPDQGTFPLDASTCRER